MKYNIITISCDVSGCNYSGSVSGTGSVSESGIGKGLKFRDGDGNVFTYDGTGEDGLERFIHDDSGEVLFLRPDLVGNSSVGFVPVEETEEGAGLSPETSVEVRDSEGAGQEAGVSSEEGESVAIGTALSQIPVDENWKPRFSEADPELAWDALVERTQDEALAQTYADNMVASREAALEKAEKAKPKANSDNLQVETQEKIETESNSQEKTGEVSQLTEESGKPQPSQAESATTTETPSLAATALSSLERAGLGESDVAGELRRMAAEEAEEKSQEVSSEEYQAGQETKRQDTGNQEKVDKKREESGHVEKIGDVGEKTEDGKRVLFQQTDETLNNDSEARELATTAVLEALHQAGIDVEVATPEMVEEVLGRANDPLTKIRKRTEQTRLSAKRKRALETVSVQNSDEHQQTAISSADGAKILENLDTLANEYEKNPKTNEKTFIGEVADALGIDSRGSSSKYATFETKNGNVITIRLSNHNATVSNFDNRGEADGISIVVSPKKNEGVRNDGEAHVVEYYYDAIRLRNAEGKPLSEIVRSLEQALYSGEYQDKTGLADRQEVNGEDHIELMHTPGGMVYGWTVGGKIYLTDSGLNPNTPIRAVDTGKPGQKRKSLFYIGSAHRFPNRQHHCCYIGKQW